MPEERRDARPTVGDNVVTVDDLRNGDIVYSDRVALEPSLAPS